MMPELTLTILFCIAGYMFIGKIIESFLIIEEKKMIPFVPNWSVPDNMTKKQVFSVVCIFFWVPIIICMVAFALFRFMKLIFMTFAGLFKIIKHLLMPNQEKQ